MDKRRRRRSEEKLVLSLLKIKNIALIDALEVEFGPGLNLLTGETGSGKSIMVDSLGALTGERVSSDLIKDGADSAQIEGLFEVEHGDALKAIFESSGLSIDNSDSLELIVRRELSATGKNRIYINDQLITASLLKRLAPYLVDIHGQGEQFSLFDPASHLYLLDEYADNEKLLEQTADVFHAFSAVKNELAALKRDEADKLQLVDILKFQVAELETRGSQGGRSAGIGGRKTPSQ